MTGVLTLTAHDTRAADMGVRRVRALTPPSSATSGLSPGPPNAPHSSLVPAPPQARVRDHASWPELRAAPFRPTGLPSDSSMFMGFARAVGL